MATDRSTSFPVSPFARQTFTALLVFCGCFLGARASTLWVFPGVGTAVLFFPYAVLAAALMLTPARQWWLYVLAAAAGNFWPNLRHEGLTSFVLQAESANIIRALLAAVGVRWFHDRAGRFDTLRDMVVFLLFAVALGPAVGALIGAVAVVHHNPAADFWIVCQAWLLSNMLTGLTLLPLILILYTSARKWTGHIPAIRLAEAVALGLGMIVVGSQIFTRAHGSGAVPAILYAPLPLLLWAAVRFGPGGMIAALSALTALTIAGALNGRGPFIAHSPGENLMQLQYFLIALCAPLLLLAAIVRQHTQTAEALRQSQAEYRTVVEDQTEMICRFLPDGTYTFVNGAYCRCFQHSPEELLGQPFWKFIPARGRPAVAAQLASISFERPVVTTEHEVVAPDGQTIWQQWTNRGFFDEQGKIVDYQAVGRDITERKLAAEEHQQLATQKQVAAALRESEARLRESEARLREANRAKDRFLAALSHELRTPLTPVLLAAEAHRDDPGLSDELRRDLHTIQASVAMEVDLIDDLLDLTRLGRGKIELKKTQVDVHALLENAARICSDQTLNSKSLRIALDLGAQRYWAMGDSTRLSQVFWNIIKNAVKFSVPGGVITMRTANVHGQKLLIEFIDTGNGIEPAELSRIFDAFEQGGRDVTRKYGGMGLGLALCKAFVEMHGGRIWATSGGHGMGATFHVQLSAIEVAQASRTSIAPLISNAAPIRQSLTPPRTGARILLVEDHEFTANLLARLLRTSGHDVLNAHNVATALETAARCPIDLVISDLGLPDGTGLELMSSLARKHGLRGIALSGYGMAEDLRQSREAGFVEHLVKPVSVEKVQAAICRALAHSDEAAASA